jgi:L-aspartate oxidase
MSVHESDILVLGSGIAGLSFALKAARYGRVALVTKKQRAQSNTNLAQGGIAAVFGGDDDFDLHLRDTLSSGAGLCHKRAVEDVVRAAPERIRELMTWGARFSEEQGQLALGREGGHSRRRIVHAADLTGREVERALLEALAQHVDVELYEHHIAVDLLTGIDSGSRTRRCAGAVVLDDRSGELIEFCTRFTLLATGGLGQAYRHTTNPTIATGDGVAMAFRAGAEVANLEFVQFHPTALYPAEERAVLISEAVRGEGAVLRRMDGSALLDSIHMGSLATRDVVARTIDLWLKESGDPYVLLDLSMIPADRIEARFPNIYGECQARGLDIRKDPIPVVPAAHYSCGGVRTDGCGRTSLPGLFAAGEVACTGVHGANRLASNSLLEALVFSHRAALEVPGQLHRRIPDLVSPATGVPGGGVHDAAAVRRELRTLMWEHAGIVRSDARLKSAHERLLALREQIAGGAGLNEAGLELRNLIDVSLLIVRCALLRRESRGLNYNLDHPFRDNERFLRDTVLVPEVV